MTNKEKLIQLKNNLQELLAFQNEIMRTTLNDGEVKLTINDAIQLQGNKLKIDSINKQIGELTQIVLKEEREEYGYTVFGLNENRDTEARVIPYSLKEKYDSTFNILESTSFPNISDIERFLNENNLKEY